LLNYYLCVLIAVGVPISQACSFFFFVDKLIVCHKLITVKWT
jgi:hypothetical protein